MAFSVRREILAARGVPHGGIDYGRLRTEGGDPGEVLDFSVSTNPFGPCPEVMEAMKRASLDRYPDSSSGELRETIARKHGVEPGSVLVVNGISQAIFLIAFAFADRGSAVVEVSPTYGEYAAASRLAGARVEEIRAPEETSFAFPAERVEEAVLTGHPSMVWICSPNNPTGFLPSGEELGTVTRACEKEGALLVLDEAYANFSTRGPSAGAGLSPSVLLLRSMTKDYALTGLRLGYVLGDPSLVQVLAAVQPPWSVNACAQECGLAALGNGAYYEATWRAARDLLSDLSDGLREAGFHPLPSQGNFVLFRAGDSNALRSFLWKDRILIRDCTSFGLPGYVRAGIRRREENRMLVDRLRAFREGRS